MPSRVGSAAIGEATQGPKEVAPIVKEGYMFKRGEYIRNWRARYYILRADGVFHGFKSKEEAQTSAEIQNDFMLQEDVTIVTHEKPKLNTFIVQGIILRGMQVDRIYYTETAEDREEWISAIQAVVDALGVGNWRSAFNELGEREEKMYDISLLNSSSKTLNDLPPNLIVRPLQLSDYDKGFLELLSQRSSTGNISKPEFRSLFKKMASPSNTYYVTVVEDTAINRVISTATLVTELQFNQRSPMVGWIKDIVIDNSKGNQPQLKNVLVNTLKDLGETCGCSRVESINTSLGTQDGDI